MNRALSLLHRAPVSSAGRAAAPVLQRKASPEPEAPSETHGGCACGGGCPRCATATHLQTKPIEGLIQRDFETHPEHTDEEVFAAMNEQPEEKQPVEEEEPAMDMGHMHAKLVVGGQTDPAENQADRVADAVVAGGSAPPISSIASAGTISHAAAQDSGIKPSQAMARYVSNPGTGSALPRATRSLVETGLGVDFSHVRLHTDARAQQAAADIGARAFTMGSNIWLGKGESPDDVQLVAHELTHVVQQGHAGQQQLAPAAPQVQRKIIKAPAALVAYIEGAADKSEKREDPVSKKVVPAHKHMLEHEDWHTSKHPDPGDPEGKDINDSFGSAFMEFHHAMMDGFKAAGGSASTWGATTAPPTSGDFSRFSDPAKLALIKTANNFGNLILNPHNISHGDFAGADPEDAGMNDFYWAPRHDVFYKLHMWMDDRYTDWKALKAPKKSSP